MKLVHYSGEPLGEIRSVEQRKQRVKPKGLWVSVDEPGGHGWKEYCDSVERLVGNFEHAYEVRLAEAANVLRLRGGDDIDRFAQEWKWRNDGMIDWRAVAAKYQGIIIAPYSWSHRLEAGIWYYGWDCASGCIWDARAIESATPIEVELAVRTA